MVTKRIIFPFSFFIVYNALTMHFQSSTKRLSVSRRVKSKTKSLQFFVNKTKLMTCFFFLHWFSIPIQYLFQACLSTFCIVLSIIKQFLSYITFVIVLKLSLQQQKHDESYVYISTNCKLCFSLKTRGMILKIWLTI